MRYAIVPAYNEEKTIGEVIKRLKKLKFKVLVIDDGSKDKTYEIAKSLKVDVIRHEKNRGKGEALKTAFDYLKNKKFSSCIIIDADMQFLPEEAPKIAKMVEKGYDIVMGARNWSKVPFRHKLGNFVWRFLFNLLFGVKLKDTNCGFIGLSRKALSKIEKIYGGYIIENSILAEGVRKNMKITNVPVKVFYHKKSKFVRGIKVVSGVSIFIIKEGLKYLLSKL
ncbi:MAG: glycosyltransferase family 2 protein [Candidatus Aenigmatarchaeota archaeon]